MRPTVLALVAVIAVACADSGAGTPGSVIPSPQPTGTSTIAPAAATALPGSLTPVATLSASSPSALTARESARVLSVVDGDTIRVEIRGQTYTVRYIGIDTPESGRPYFREATDANQRLVEGRAVLLEKDISETDRFGRLLRYVYIESFTGVAMVNAELVRLGFANVATFPPDVKHADLFVQLEREARAAQVGLWAAPTPTSLPPPPAPTSAPPTVTAAPAAAQHSVALTVTSPVRRGARAGAIAQTTARSSCAITVTYASGPSRAQGLDPKTADDAGGVTWSWTVGTNTTLGSWPVDVRCTSPGGQSASARQFFVVQ